MRLPKRRAQLLQIRIDEGPEIMTSVALERMKRTVEDLKTHQRPQTVEDLSFARQQGDLSENAEYQDARTRLSQIDGRIFSITEKIKRASVIEKETVTDGWISLGSTVTVHSKNGASTYTIVGPLESAPSRGRISHISPLGRALIGHRAGDNVEVTTPSGTIVYHISDVR